MAQAPTPRMSAVRERHAAHPTRPTPASKPGVPSTASVPRGGSQNTGRGTNGSMTKGSMKSGRDEKRSSLSLSELSLPGGGDTSLPHPRLSMWTRLAGKLLKRLAQRELRKLAKAAGTTLEAPALDALAKPGLKALEAPARMVREKQRELDLSGVRPGLPIQQSVDIAVPLEFAWQKWLELSFLPEGIDQVVDIERDGEELSGRLADSGSSWSAQILDERECESFAWRSDEGSDCAGLVTFHRLSDRLTRIELSLDVVPSSLGEAAYLLSHLADRRAGREMRRFKAELEVISPDVYADGSSEPPE